MAVVYGHLFPLVVLFAVYGLYSAEQHPLRRHLGELLAITILSGACFALPIAVVRERERGVWLRYRLTPEPRRVAVPATLLAHYLNICFAGAVQLGVALALGTPLPAHPLQLAGAFAVTAFALVGLGLLLSTLADTVNAAQALGQCVFLPMLMLGGVAVRVQALPEWARSLSAFFPGRYAVEALQACVTGSGLGSVRFQLAALLLFGVASLAAALAILPWRRGERVRSPAARATGAAALAVWALVGWLAISGGAYGEDARPATAIASAPRAVSPGSGSVVPGVPAPADTRAPSPDSPRVGRTPAERPAPAAGQAAALQQLDRAIDYSGLPPDDGLVAPVARASETPPAEISDQLECMRMMIPGWAPGRVADPVQRVRNYLYVAAVVDVYQTGDLERWVPLLVAEQLTREMGREELARALARVASSPGEGDMSATAEMRGVCFERDAPADAAQVRERVGFYALKLLGRETGRLPR